MPAPAGAPFPFLVLALRWATVATGTVFIASEDYRHPGVIGAAIVLVAYSVWRTFRPLPSPGRFEIGTPVLAVDIGVALLGVAASGGWDSPFIFVLLPGVLLAGFVRGYFGGLVTVGAIVTSLALAAVVSESAQASPQVASQAALVCTATAAVAGYSRRLFLEAQASQAAFSDRVATLTEANALLAQLTKVAQTLPASLDLGNTLAASMAHLRQLFDFTGSAILVFDPATATWRTEAAAGHQAPPSRPTSALPDSLRSAARDSTVRAEPGLDGQEGLFPGSRSGLYGPLIARGRLVALVAIEHDEPGRFGPREAELLTGLTEPLALAIDNGLWFDRLRILGAEGERERLARNLHDRVGQGLAYVGLELDRLARHPEPGPQLVHLRQDVSGLLAEVRETLRQLRSRVTETTGLAALAEAHLPRFAERTGIEARFVADTDAPRLPPPVEQELWRILQEALANVERHSGATSVTVSWSAAAERGRLEVVDDGKGFDQGVIDPAVTTGLMAMRERANAVGARLVIESSPGQGTRVLATVEVQS